MRDKGSWSDVKYASRVAEVKTRGGSATFEGEQRARQGKGLDPLIDPKELGVIRQANNLLVPDGKEFILKYGVAMPVKTDSDTTGSMGGNVDVIFRVQPKVQNLLIQGKNAVLRRYHTQMATGVIQDASDQFPYQHSQFEPDNEVEKQMGLLVPERDGGDAIEDYQLGLFAAAYLTQASITKYGLRGYYFVVGDQRGRAELDSGLLKRVFGPEVLEKAFGKKSQSPPSLREMGKKLLQDWHIFFLQVGADSIVSNWWKNIIGAERIIQLPRTEDVAELQACIIGLTEGEFDLQGAAGFMRGAGVPDSYVMRIVDACGQIPIGLQTTFPNFGKIPAAGARFASREDIWPIGAKLAAKPKKDDAEPKPKPGKGKKDPWKL